MRQIGNRNNPNRVRAQMNLNRQLSDELRRGQNSTSEYNPVDLTRSYGRKKREIKLWEIFKLSIARVIAAVFLFFLLSIPTLGLFTFLAFGNLLVSTLVVAIAALVFAFAKLKPVRKRLRFRHKLKKICKEKRYKMTVEQGFFDSLFWSPDRIDLTVNTGRFIYRVHYLTVTKYRSSVTFVDDHTFVKTKYPLRNVFTVIFSFKPKSRVYSLDFPKTPEDGRHKYINAIVVNPVCNELFIKNRDGQTEPTGSGGECFGYKIFTGSGFISELVRNEENAKHDAGVWY